MGTPANPVIEFPPPFYANVVQVIGFNDGHILAQFGFVATGEARIANPLASFILSFATAEKLQESLAVILAKRPQQTAQEAAHGQRQ